MIGERTFDRKDLYVVVRELNAVILDIRAEDADLESGAYKRIRGFLLALPLTNMKPSSSDEVPGPILLNVVTNRFHPLTISDGCRW